ncbi:hypothetical protein FraQA3DRAFT_0708 [Frankia sp. QA3]|nr:hypothetical protein FraQA3DRAFT_0708 [Frankia sp. QA3]
MAGPAAADPRLAVGSWDGDDPAAGMFAAEPAGDSAADETWRIGSVGGGLAVNPGGPTHTGEGDLLSAQSGAHGAAIAVAGDVVTFLGDHVRQAGRRHGRPAPLAASTLRDLADVFVRPDGWARARAVLERERMVLLLAAAGQGRRTAGGLLAAQAGGAAAGLSQVWRLPVEVDEADPGALPRDVPRRAGLLLDLCGSDLPPAAEQTRRLEALRARVGDAGAERHLVVLLPPDAEAWLPVELRTLAEPLGRPDWREVLTRHWEALLPRPSAGLASLLNAAAPPAAAPPAAAPSDATLVDPVLAGLAGATIDQVSRVAREAARWQGDHPGDEPATCLRQAWETVGRDDARGGEEIDKLLAEDATGRRASLLVAAAMLAGADRDAVLAAERRLAAICGLPPVDTHPLASPGYRLRLRDLGIGWNDRRRIEFDPPQRAAIVRGYAWDNYPLLRADFLGWAVAVVVDADRHLTARDLGEFGVRFAAQSLRVDRPEDALTLARRWVERRGAAAMGSCSRLLEEGLAVREEGTGGVAFRRAILTWSRNRHLNTYLALLCVQLCEDFVALTYPRQALTRLHNFTAHEDPQVAARALVAAERLATADPEGYRHLLDRVLRAPQPVAGSAGNREVFLRLAAVPRLCERHGGWRAVDDADVRDLLRAGWVDVIDQDLGAAGSDRRSQSRLSPAVEQRIVEWLDGPDTDIEPPRTGLADLLVDGLRDRFDLLATLRLVCCHADREGLDTGALTGPGNLTQSPSSASPSPGVRAAYSAGSRHGRGLDAARAGVVARIDYLLGGGEPLDATRDVDALGRTADLAGDEEEW